LDIKTEIWCKCIVFLFSITRYR